MYPRGELNLIQARKTLLRHRIAQRRMECADAAAGLVSTLEFIDRATERFRQISAFTKLVAMPLSGFFLARFALKKEITARESAPVRTPYFQNRERAFPEILSA